MVLIYGLSKVITIPYVELVVVLLLKTLSTYGHSSIVILAGSKRDFIDVYSGSVESWNFWFYWLQRKLLSIKS